MFSLQSKGIQLDHIGRVVVEGQTCADWMVVDMGGCGFGVGGRRGRTLVSFFVETMLIFCTPVPHT